jgi:ketosteroid isomerase-like protein
MQIKGNSLNIFVRDGDSWKARAILTNNAAPPPEPAAANAVPTSAQEKSVVDPEVRQQIKALMMKFQEAYNNRDATAIGALLTQDAIEVRSWPAEYRGGLASGREALQKRFEADFATNPGKMVNKLVQLYPIGSAICEITNSVVGGWKAQTVAIWVPDGDTWKSSMTMSIISPMWSIHNCVSRLKPRS